MPVTMIDVMKNLVKEESIFTYNPDCIRKKSNMTHSAKEYRFDNPSFNPEQLKEDIPLFSPKLDYLLKKIDELDKADLKAHGKQFKHFIFSDLKMAPYGAKLITSALIANGYSLGYRPTRGSIELIPEEDLKKEDSSFFLLSSISVYDKPIPVKVRKEILSTFNKRPDNIHGKIARFIVMDSGFKEGIDLFDIKYVHIFEPSVNPADQKQVIGRGTRTCGQKGLDFHPTNGWPLHVFVYDLEFPEKHRHKFLNTNSAFELYMKSMNLDFRKLTFAQEIEELSVYGAVDYELNLPVHEFANRGSSSSSSSSSIGGNPTHMNVSSRRTHREPDRFQYMRKLIRDHFNEYKWESVKMENQCIDKVADVKDEKKGGAPKPMNYTPTQNFISHYFSPQSPVKGMLLWHSTGTGKTCTAIAAASHSFEPQDYTVLWVTRTTLKNDIWKNMFEQICSESIKSNIDKIPSDPSKQKKMLSKSWAIKPLSYKQFSNLVSQQNDYYKRLVEINGREDPLRKTLLIIDEAHKLYGGGDLSSIERPDMVALHKAIMHSYAVSGQDSVRILLMTATPITLDGMELIKLLNLCRPIEEQLPASFETFQDKYLTDTGTFTTAGKKDYLDDIAGHLSYLNREKDARQFSQPIVERVLVPILKDSKLVDKFDKGSVTKEDGEMLEFSKETDAITEELEGEIREINPERFSNLKVKCDSANIKKTTCDKIVKSSVRELVKELRDYKKVLTEKLKELKTKIKSTTQFKKGEIKQIRENIKNYPEQYEEYKKTPFFLLSSECANEKKTNLEILEDLKENPVILKFKKEVEDHELQIQQMKDSLKIHIDSYKIKQRELNRLLKESTGDITVDRILAKNLRKDSKSQYTKRTNLIKKNISHRIVLHKKSIKLLNQQEKKMYKKVRESLKKSIKLGEKNNKNTRTEELKLKKIQSKSGKYIEFMNENIKEIIKKKQDELDEKLKNAKSDIDEEEDEKERKKAEKKEEKQKEREEKMKEKQKEKEEKQKEKEEKQKKKKENKI